MITEAILQVTNSPILKTKGKIYSAPNVCLHNKCENATTL